MKKYKSFIIILFLAIIPTFSIADDSDKENFRNYDKSIEVFSNISSVPVINAKHALILDRSSKTVLYSRQEYDMCKMASTTKIMTAIVVLEKCSDLNEQVTISKKSARNRRFKTWFIIR